MQEDQDGESKFFATDELMVNTLGELLILKIKNFDRKAQNKRPEFISTSLMNKLAIKVVHFESVHPFTNYAYVGRHFCWTEMGCVFVKDLDDLKNRD